MNTADTNPADIQSRLEQFIREIGRIPPTEHRFSSQSELFDAGYLDSLGIVALTTYVEQHFGITLTEDQLFDSRFTTIAGIAQIISAAQQPTAKLAPARSR